ncbi:MAG TPA: trypsin-like serine protease [Afifellaceae bacterium]|nr:trypsin-like serine protease [Afifellaceae bacterium]
MSESRKRGDAMVLFLVIPLLLGSAVAADGTATEPAEPPQGAGDAVAAGQADGFETAPVQTPSEGVRFAAVLDLRQKGDPFVPQLRRGYVASSVDWPASLYVTFETPQGQAACTAALIGPQVMLTAAHCVPDSGKVDFSFGGTGYNTSCTRHPQYESGEDPSADYALCRLAIPFAEPPGFGYETVDVGPMEDLLTQNIILTGFGCRSDVVADDNVDGLYRYGFNSVEDTSLSPARTRGARYYAPEQDNNLFTGQDAANLCPGDSGGPTYKRTGSQGASIRGRRIIGVNSRVFFADRFGQTFGSSLISSTGSPEFRDWAKAWVVNEAVEACGIVSPVTIPNCGL